MGMKSDDTKKKIQFADEEKKNKKKMKSPKEKIKIKKKKIKIQTLMKEEQQVKPGSSLRSCSTQKRKKIKIETLMREEQEQGSSRRSCSTRKRKKMKSGDEKVNLSADFKLGTQYSHGKPQPAYNTGDVVNLSDLLFTKERDFLITYKDRDRPVQAKHLEGKVVVLHFLPLVPRRGGFKRYPTNILKDIYHFLQPNGGFEVVYIGVAVDNVPDSNQDELSVDHPTLEECFEDTFSIMPWTAIPFSDVKSRAYWESIFPLSCFLYNHTSTSVVIDPTGRVSQCDADDTFFWYGARAYPFTGERRACISAEYEEALKHPNITELLASPERNHLINNKNQVIPLHNLEDKVVGLFFLEGGPYHYLTAIIKRAYESLAKEKNFEIVLVYIHDRYGTAFSSEKSYWETFKTMPWLALPYKDPTVKKLQRVFHYPMEASGPGPDRGIVFIGPQGKFVEQYGADILVRYDISAYPFSRYTVAKIEAERIRKEINLNMFWPQITSFVKQDGSTVEFSQLVGKKIILIVENDWCYPDAKFWRRLRTRYLQMKGTKDQFEVIHICKKEKGYSYGKDVATTSWLTHPSGFVLGRAGCVFSSVLGLFAFDHYGRIVRRTSRPTIERRYIGFPFGDMEEELLRVIEEKYEWNYDPL